MNAAEEGYAFLSEVRMTRWNHQKKTRWLSLGLLCLVVGLGAACSSPTTNNTNTNTNSNENSNENNNSTSQLPDAPDYCKKDQPPDAACYAQKRDPQSTQVKLALDIALKQIKKHPANTVKWDWGESVMMFGIIELYRVTQDKRLREYIQGWIDEHIKEGYKIRTSDTCPPSHAAIVMYQETKDDKYKKVLDTFMTYIFEQALRDENGGLNHLGVVDSLGVSLWLDSLFMFGTVLTRWGETTNNSKALDEYNKQFMLFTKLLQKENGLYLHAHGWPGEMDTDIFWARGNAWVTAATFEYLRARRGRGETDQPVLDAIKKQVQGAIDTQDAKTGLWWSIVNRPNKIYLETSASALFAYGMARGYRYGFLDKSVLPVIQKAMAGVKSKIETNSEGEPVIKGTSGPTNVGTFAMYERVDQKDDISYGIGAVILALLETSGLPD